jgi:hypothetical protein
VLVTNETSRRSSAITVLSDLLLLISKEWQLLLTLLLRALPYLLVERNRGMYEILDYEITLNLVDPKGRKAIFHKRQRVRFLQNNILAFQDYAWGDGGIFTSYTCAPGQVVDRYQEGDRWNILISLRQTKSKGDVEDFHIERVATDGFTSDEEWLQTEIRHPTRRLRLSVFFPRKRHCTSAFIQTRSTNRTQRLNTNNFTDLPDGRQLLTWETANVSGLEVFTLRWRW